MTQMSVSVTPEMKAYVEEVVSTGKYGNASEYMRNLIREDQRRQTQERLEELLIAGLESGPAVEMTNGDWSGLRKRLEQRIKETGKR